MKKNHYVFQSFAAIVMLLMFFCLTLANAQTVSNKGKDFLMTFLPNTLSSNHAVELHLTGDVATTVTIEYPANSPTFTTTASITPGTVTIVSLPTTASTGWAPGVITNNAVHAFANEEFVCYMINIRNFTSDAALALPISALNTDYIALTYNSTIVTADRSFFVVVAPFNNTTVTITPTNALASGQPAGVPFNITLNSGEGWLAQGTTFGPSGDLSGTIVEADRPIGVTNGNLCTNVPPNQTFCDHIFEVAHAVQTWGNRALVSNLSNIPAGSIYRIMASEDNTTVNQNGAFLATLNKGQFHETPRLPGDHEFSADKPIFVAQYMTGIDPGFGDPAMGNMIPPEQYLSAYTFSTVGGARYAQHNATIIAEDVDVNNGTIFLDGAVIPAGSFTPIGTTGFQATIQSLAEGSHNTSSTTGVHGITVWGVNEDDSYLYPGGALFQFIAPGQDTLPPICQLTITGNVGNGVVTDDRPDDSGIFFVELLSGSVNLDLAVDPFTPGDPVVTYTVSLIDPNQSGNGVVRAIDGSGNQCTSVVDIVVQPQQETVFLTCGGGDDEVPPVTTSAEIGGMFTLNSTQDSLFFDITVNYLSGPIAAAHFHNAAAGVNGPVVRTLTGDFVGSTATGVWTSTDAEPLTAALVAELLAGNIYVNVHTAANPGGEARGQLETGNTIDLFATLDGSQEVPPNASPGTGTGVFQLSADGSALSFDITYNNLTAPLAAAHFHNAPAGVNGGVVRTLTGDFVGNNAIGVWTNADAEALTPTLVAKLLGGEIYVNIHTSNFPGGEIRGQLSCQVQPDVTSPLCELTAVLPGPPKAVEITVQDNESGLDQIIVVKAKNVTVNIPSFTVGTNDPVVVTATKINNNKGASIVVRVVDVAGNSATCDPVYTTITTTAPESYDLVQNYPNPFNPTTTIRFAIPAELEGSAHVTLKVYDLSGREVKTLINEAMAAGEYSVDWDATNNHGQKVAGGVYLYRLVSGDYAVTKKMILLK